MKAAGRLIYRARDIHPHDELAMRLPLPLTLMMMAFAATLPAAAVREPCPAGGS